MPDQEDVQTEAAPAEQAVGGKRKANEPVEGEPEAKIHADDDADGEDASGGSAGEDAGTEEAEEVDAEADADAEAGNDQEPEQGGDESQEAGQEDEAEDGKQAMGFPLQLGPKTFTGVDKALSFFRNIINQWPDDFVLNEFEHRVLSALLHDHHPRPRSKIKDGIIGFKVKVRQSHGSKCFYICYEDGTEDDFSYLKCLSTVAGYDLTEALRQKKAMQAQKPGRGGLGGRRTSGRFGSRGRGRGRGGRGKRS